MELANAVAAKPSGMLNAGTTVVTLRTSMGNVKLTQWYCAVVAVVSAAMYGRVRTMVAVVLGARMTVVKDQSEEEEPFFIPARRCKQEAGLVTPWAQHELAKPAIATVTSSAER